ncbi:CRISPR-associated helicase/endonuclease Cas3 [Desulfonema ishimotonii]|uniref:CRISPR-associated endonuclease Cas1 n=1 Tax=Desulfonema ishimotonii TaxID=45657 RepID=A0A401FWW9_9BACT|nr:type I-E CRISPR-associated endonuclease Cas1e [Desulfonema ishimotonii]GBC61451.1 CRISPR-associated helicase/endonuclease Cas3 [Desulfonema ishimotonii]
MEKELIFWGKSERKREAGELQWMSVWAHSLNVTAVAQAWLTERESLLTRWAALLGTDRNGITRQDALRVALHFTLLHDLGKYHFRFQGKNAGLFEALNSVAIPASNGSFDHGAWGFQFYGRHLTGRPGVPEKTEWYHFMRAVASHHGTYADPGGRTPKKVSGASVSADVLENARKRAVAGHIGRAARYFPLPEFGRFKNIRADAVVFLAGLCSVADWLGSDSDFFPCGPVRDTSEPEFITSAMTDAARAVLERNHLLGRYCGEPETRLSRIFPGIGRLRLRPLQQAACDLALNAAPRMIIIEAPMGEGKTEAAMILADRLLSAGYAEKLYFALPTMATSNAMYGRMSAMMADSRFFDENSSLVLAHGKRHLKEEFQRHVRIPENRETISDAENPPAGMMCSRFFSQSHKRSLLAQAGVGTVDQIMSAVLRKRHHWVKLFALSDAVVIIDEVHAYDAYMREILGRLASWLRAMGSHVILLSATLPHSVRQEISGAFGDLPDVRESREYPLMTHMVSGEKPRYIPCESVATSEKEVVFEATHDADAMADRVIRHARAGAQCCVILNTVAKAQEFYGLLADSERCGGLDIMLFHSRFMFRDRNRIEETVLARFGKHGDRSRGRILVATQVAEQSLDVDFDVMVSEIAPVDLLLQRAGRLHRFPENNRYRRGTPWERPRLTVFMPCETAARLLDDRIANPEARSVYDAAILFRTALLFENEDRALTVRIPDDIRPLVDRVYDGQEMEISPDDADRYEERWEEWKNLNYEQGVMGANAGRMMPDNRPGNLENKKSYQDDAAASEATDELQPDGTRLAPRSVRVVFADAAWLVREDLQDRAGAYRRFHMPLEEHSLSVIRGMLRGACSEAFNPHPDRMLPEEWHEIRKRFEQELPRWETHLILPVPVTENERYAFGGSGVVLEYSASRGLKIEYPESEADSFFRLKPETLAKPAFENPEPAETELAEPRKSRRPAAPAKDLIAKVRSNPLKSRISYLHVGHARLDVDDSGLVMTSADGDAFRQIPVASMTLILLEPGSVVTHEAVKLCAKHKCLLIWVGEGGVRLYSAGYSDFARADKILNQARMYNEPKQRLAVVRRMFEIRFRKPCPRNKSIGQLRGMEGSRVKKYYRELSGKYGVEWDGRLYDQSRWDRANTINRVISVGTSCLYGIAEAAILTAGYSPAIGFLHSGKDRSFVYDIADLYKEELVFPLCFELVRDNEPAAESLIRHHLRDVFKKTRFLERLIPDIEEILRPVE